MEHEDKQLESRHVQEHLNTRGYTLPEQFTAKRPADSKSVARAETPVARIPEELCKQDNCRYSIPDKRSVSRTRHAKRRYRAQAKNQHEVAGNIYNHAHERCLHHNLRLADTAKEARCRISHQRNHATEHQDVKICLLVFQLVCRQMFQPEGEMPQGDCQIQ